MLMFTVDCLAVAAADRHTDRHTDTQTRETAIHFASSTTHAKCNKHVSWLLGSFAVYIMHSISTTLCDRVTQVHMNTDAVCRWRSRAHCSSAAGRRRVHHGIHRSALLRGLYSLLQLQTFAQCFVLAGTSNAPSLLNQFEMGGVTFRMKTVGNGHLIGKIWLPVTVSVP